MSASARKEDSKPVLGSPAPEPGLSSADDLVPDALPKHASEPDLGGAAQAHLEGTHPPVPAGDTPPAPATLEDPPGPAPGGGSVLTTVTVSGRDPRTAPGAASTVTAPAAAQPPEPRPDPPKPVATSVTVPKSILAKPSTPPEPRYLLSIPPSPSTR